tara:strand:+ start:4604 stop:4924 length:321 start_codon:yes stop_codon:yes gene_type:complete
MEINGRFDHIEDVLVRLHRGQWFGWSDNKNKVYENLVIDDESKEKPTQKFLEDELKKQQDEFDAQAYARSRSKAYDPIPEQLDQIYHDMDGWKAKIKAVKDKYPKP